MKLWPAYAKSFADAWLTNIARLRGDDVREIADIQTHTVTSRTLASRIDAVGNVGAGEDNLITYELPSGVLSRDNTYIEFEMAFTFAANANSKRVRAYFGATLIYDSGAQNQNGGDLVVRGVVIRASTATEKIYTVASVSSGSLYTAKSTYAAGTESLLSTVIVKATGEGVSNNDIQQQTFTFKFYPAA